MVPIRHVTFLDSNGRPLRTVPSHLTPLEEEVQGDAAEQDAMVEFDESSAPAPAHASVHHTILPAPVGAARELMSLRRSNVLNDPPLRRRRRRAAKRQGRNRSRSGSRTASRPKRRPAARASRSSSARRPASSRSSRGSRTLRTRTTRRTVRRTTVSRRR